MGRLAEIDHEMSLAPAPGHNHPPGPIEDAKIAITDLSRFLAACPVIESEDQARQGKLHVDRTRATLGAMETARDASVRPLNEQVRDINAEFKAASVPLTKVLDEVRARLTAFAKAEETKREAAAEAARASAFEAERIAREAEDREREVKENATFGEIADVGQAIVDADRAFSEFEARTREASRAERETNVRIGGGFSGRALSMRKKETLVLESYGLAMKAIGPNPKIEEAILSAARDYRTEHGSLPNGVKSVTERKI